MKKTILLGVTGSIAAYKSLELVKDWRKEEKNVHVIMTASAAKIVPVSDFEKASGNNVSTDLFDKEFNFQEILKSREVEHIQLADKADVFVIAPATANIIAKIAHGMADDYLTTTALAVTVPIIICPAMNVHMWNNAIVQRNIAILRNHGYHIVAPEAGLLACGYEGVGRLADLKTIKKVVASLLA